MNSIVAKGGVAAAAVLAASAGVSAGVSWPATMPGETASMALRQYQNPSNNGFINAGGAVNVARGPTFTSLGANVNGSGQIEGRWDEIVGDVTRIQVIWRTSNQEAFIPAGALINGAPVQFLGWEFGNNNPVNFGPWVQHVELIGATLSSSDDWGNNILDTFDVFSAINSPNPWDGTGGVGAQGSGFWQDANWIELELEYQVVPAPAAAGTLALAGVVGAFRRRRS